MKKLYVLAALLMASTAAQAGNSISFEIDGHKIHIEAPRNCDALSCIQVSAPGLSGSDFGFKGIKSSHSRDNDDVAPRTDSPAPKSVTTPPSQVAAAPQPSTSPANNAPAPATAIATANPPPSAGNELAPPVPTAAPPVAPKPVATAPAPTTPLGVWTTEENKGMVRIEQCGQNLCGYSVKTGAKILIDMKPSDAKWMGQIYDPDSGKTYDSNIAMKGQNSLRVQGCAFGGMFCGGQTWSRVS
jgi:Uncharacterized protein conserved in bacteria (DUF2147)